MPLARKYTTDQIAAKLREADALTAKGATIPHVSKKLGIPELTLYRWLHKFGDLSPNGITRLDHLELELALLRQIIAEQADHISLLVRGSAGQGPDVRGERPSAEERRKG